MKKNRSYLIIGVSSLALLVVLLIQVNWIFQTAKIKEEIFNEKANIVLSRTTDAICADKETCMRIGQCIERDSANKITANLQDNEVQKIDSLFNHFMDYYNFHVDYTFVLVKDEHPKGHTNKAFMSNTFYRPMDELTTITGMQLKLVLPDKKQYIMAEMGPMFITSVLLILIVIVMFWRTILSLIKEKKIAEHTTEFLNNMTHEFKTPLTNIALAGKMLMKDTQFVDNEKSKQYSAIILAENEKLRLQVEHVLSLTALERGEMPLQKSNIDVHQLIHSVLNCMSIQIEEKNGSVNLQLEAEHFMINADNTHLTNALCNLLDNAIKYNDGELRLNIKTSNQGNKLHIEISDNGIGIEKEFQKNVFEKYFRVPTGDVHNVKGFGLGLSYVKKIIELHNGSIELQSDKGKGTTFSIIIPNAN
jgi:two-component system phosphate regulon sensor histidine kinase PhoR